MPRQQQQVPTLSTATMGSRGGGRGGGASAAEIALSRFVDGQNAATNRMMANFQKLQEAQAQEAQMGAAQFTQGLNQIVRRQEEIEKRELRKEDIQEERKYAEEYQVWSQELNEQTKKDQMLVLERLAQQKDAAQAYVSKWDQQKQSFGDYINALREQAYQWQRDGTWEATPGGLEKYRLMQQHIKAARALQEHHLQADHATKAMRLLNQTRLDILGGKDYMDLSALEVDPSMRELPDTSGTEDEPMPVLTDEEIREVEQAGGYVPGGLFGRDPADPELQKHKGWSVFDYRTAMEELMDEQVLAMMTTNRDRDKYLAFKMKKVEDTDNYLKPLLEFEQSSWDAMDKRGSEAVLTGLNTALNEVAGGAALASGEDLKDLILDQALGAVLGPESDGLKKELKSMNAAGEGRTVMDTPAEWFKAVHLMNALQVVDQQLNFMAEAPAEGGGLPIVDAIANQLTRGRGGVFGGGGAQGPYAGLVKLLAGRVEYGSRAAGIYGGRGEYSADTMARVSRGIRRVLGEVQSVISRQMNSLRHQPIIESVRADTRWVGQYGDHLAFSYMSNKNPDGTTKGLTSEDLAEIEEQAATETVEGLGEGGWGFGKLKMEAELSMTPLAAAAEMAAMYSNRSDLMPALLAGGYDQDLPNFSGDAQQALPEARAFFTTQREQIMSAFKRQRERVMGQGQKGQQLGPQQQGPPGPQSAGTQDEPMAGVEMPSGGM